VKEIQKKVGKDKLAVLMLSVDLGWGSQKDEAARDDKKILDQQHVDWPNVLLPNGFDDSQRFFNLDGYGLTLVGADGKVKAIDIRAESLENLL